MMTFLRKLGFIAVIAALSGCASVDFDAPKTATYALTDTGDTFWGELIEGRAEAHPGKAGFYPVADGIDALALRLLMAEKAERTIDAQYYLITNDVVGFAFIDVLLRAADRGVRVRLLLDDIQTKGYDAGMAALDSHPNFEVRIYNPFAQRSARFLDGLTSFSRVNRRMHNKSFTADNQITLIGGRNIADEYFGASADVRFGDLDVLSIGPIVGEVSDMFDFYWNNIAAVPIPAFAKMPEDPAAALLILREKIGQSQQEILGTPYAAAVEKRERDYFGGDDALFTWAPYVLAYDSPDKIQKRLADTAASIRTPLVESLSSAREEILMVSPYFVPRESGIEALVEVQKRGVDITIVTNSLAANNHTVVHGGYAHSRKPLLKEGIKIYEVRGDAAVSGAEITSEGDSGRSTLHTKAFAVDRRQLFIGSFNFDPRSAYINTELGVIIDSAELTAPLIARFYEMAPTQAYEVILNEKGQLRWRGIEDGQEVIYDVEPQTTWWTRFVASFMTIIPIKGQL